MDKEGWQRTATWGYALWKILNTMIATNNVCNMFAIQAYNALSYTGKSSAVCSVCIVPPVCSVCIVASVCSICNVPRVDDIRKTDKYRTNLRKGSNLFFSLSKCANKRCKQ